MPVSVERIVTSAANGRAEARARIRAGDDEHDVWFRWPGEAGGEPAGAFLVIALFAAMRLGTELRVAGPVSARLLRNLPKVQGILHCWDRGLRKVSVDAAAEEGGQGGRSDAPRGGAASTFSGGVDSFYTVLEHHRQLDALVYVRGFDVPLESTPLSERVATALRSAAARLDRPLIEVQTNLRQFTDRYLKWQLAYGAGLAAVGMVLDDLVSLLYVPAGVSYGDLSPDGGHPLLNPLYGTERIDFETDGCAVNRFEKVAAIATSDIAMDTLRVCWENRDGAYNCGRCEKCLRTMAALEIVGALPRCRTFDTSLDYGRLVRAHSPYDDLNFFMRENLDAAERLGAPAALQRALRRNLQYHRARVLLRPLWARARRWAGSTAG